MRTKRRYFRAVGAHAEKLEAVFIEQVGVSLKSMNRIGTVTLRCGGVTAVMVAEGIFVHALRMKSINKDLQPISEYKFRQAMKKAMEGGKS